LSERTKDSAKQLKTIGLLPSNLRPILKLSQENTGVGCRIVNWPKGDTGGSLWRRLLASLGFVVRRQNVILRRATGAFSERMDRRDPLLIGHQSNARKELLVFAICPAE
jgi:hypothetical protein